MSEKHTFAIFYSDLSKIVSSTTMGIVEFADKELVNRVLKILRMKNGESLTFFDNLINLDLEISDTGQSKHRLSGTILKLEQNNPTSPEIILMPCLLKKEAFEEVIYAAAQMAVTKIVPLISAKTQRIWGQHKEFERLTKIMISACEQSKNFIMPELHNPIKIQEIVNFFAENKCPIKAYFDPTGQNFINLLQTIQKMPNTCTALLFGPEGGLTHEEEILVSDIGFKTYALTPTILRSREAVIVGLGGVRSTAK